MNPKYRRLCQNDRDRIYRRRKEGMNEKEIAEDIGFSPSAVNREIRRNSGAKGYRSKQAGDKAAVRKLRQRRGHKIRGDLAVEVESRLRSRHSPEQVAGALAKEGVDGPSRETIYAYIAADKKAGGDLHTHLRINGKRRYRRRCKASREKIKGRVDISERPASVDVRRFFGDWEVDLLAGTRGSGYILTLAERKGRFTLLERLPDKSAGVVAAAIVRKLRGWRVRTLTYDNGTEFSRHLEAGRALGAKSYFCSPYHPWEKGLVENHNGLLRQYYPKGTSFAEITASALGQVEMELNQRPRKVLGFKSPMDYQSNLIAA